MGEGGFVGARYASAGGRSLRDAWGRTLLTGASFFLPRVLERRETCQAWLPVQPG